MTEIGSVQILIAVIRMEDEFWNTFSEHFR